MISSAFRIALQCAKHRQQNVWAAARTLSSLPDHKLIYMPALSPTMEVGTIQEWKKKVGDPIEGGEVIAEIETDKATRSYEFNDDGYLAKVFYDDGAADIPVGKLMAIVVEEESDIPAFSDYSQNDEPVETQPEPGPTPTPTPTQPPPTTPIPPAQAPAVTPSITPAQAPSPSGTRILASPLARITAANAGVSLAAVPGTGPGGRVIAADVEDTLLKGVPTPAPQQQQLQQQLQQQQQFVHADMSAFTDIDVSKFKKVTAERLLQSKQTIPHYYLTVECEVDRMLNMRAKINARAKDGEYKISVNDFVIKAAAAALRKVPEVNSQWMGDKIRMFHSADISIAVQTDQGLITPIVKDADRKGLREISQNVKDLAGKAKTNTLAPEEFMGGTFTISNLGMYGVSNFSAIVNPPQAAILAVGTSEQRVVPDVEAESGFGTKTLMNVTMSCDHRVIDGAIGAQWLSEFKTCMEDPVNIIM